MGKILTVSQFETEKKIVDDDFKKILESQDCKEIAQNFNDLYLRLPCIVAYRIKEIEKSEKL